MYLPYPMLSRFLSFSGTLTVLLLLGVAPLLAQDRGDVLIQNATVHTVTNGTLESTDILVRDGRIASIGQGLRAPSGVQVIDATDLHVMPGIIDSHSHIGISNVNEATRPVTADVGVGDVLNPYDVSIYRALAGGTTTAHLMHGSANPIGGRNQTVKLRYGDLNPANYRFEGAPRSIKFALGENPMRVHGEGQGIKPRTRMGIEFVIRDAFRRAQAYAEAREAFANGERPAPPAYNERMEVLADVLEGDLIVHSHSYRADGMLMLMQVIDDFGLNDTFVLQHSIEAFKIAPEIAAQGIPVSVFMDWWGFKFEAYNAAAHNAAILMRNGITASIHSDSGDLIRHMYHQASKSQRYGDLTDDEALSLITINPAIQLGIDDRVGSIEEGKDADLAVFSAHPLSVYAVPQMTFVDGVKRFDRATDPDDMRLQVNPEGNVAPAYANETHSHSHAHPFDAHGHGEGCMQGVNLFEFLSTK